MSTSAPAAAPAPPVSKPPSSPLRRRRTATPKPQYPVEIRPDGSRDTQLPLREHLVELRNRLIKASLAVVLTTGLAIFFMNDIAHLLTRLAGTHPLIAIS